MGDLQYADELFISIKNDLLAIPPDVFISKWIMEKIPMIFSNDEMRYTQRAHRI